MGIIDDILEINPNCLFAWTEWSKKGTSPLIKKPREEKDGHYTTYILLVVRAMASGSGKTFNYTELRETELKIISKIISGVNYR
jgi:hypothetical protein